MCFIGLDTTLRCRGASEFQRFPWKYDSHRWNCYFTHNFWRNTWFIVSQGNQKYVVKYRLGQRPVGRAIRCYYDRFIQWSVEKMEDTNFVLVSFFQRIYEWDVAFCWGSRRITISGFTRSELYPLKRFVKFIWFTPFHFSDLRQGETHFSRNKSMSCETETLANW